MPRTKTTTQTLRGRKAVVTTTAYAETLFAPGQELPLWFKRFSNTVTRFAKAAAPSHDYAKRPLRPHDRGLPLKQRFTSTVQANAALTRIDAAVGNTAPYSVFVDQGTGVYNPEGGGPYEAKVLPPWRQGEGSLYEATWTPGKNQVAPVMIKGQKGQGFMEEGLDRGFRAVMNRGAQMGGAEPRVGRALAFFPENLALRGAGNTPADAAFKANMEEWRSWRDAAFRRGDLLGKGQREGRTRKGYLKYVEQRRTNSINSALNRSATLRRNSAQLSAIQRANERKAEGARKRAEADRKQRTLDARADAVKFARALRQRGIVSTGSFSTDPKTGRPAFKVTYSQGGVTKNRYFLA